MFKCKLTTRKDEGLEKMKAIRRAREWQAEKELKNFQDIWDSQLPELDKHDGIHCQPTKIEEKKLDSKEPDKKLDDVKNIETPESESLKP